MSRPTLVLPFIFCLACFSDVSSPSSPGGSEESGGSTTSEAGPIVRLYLSNLYAPDFANQAGGETVAAYLDEECRTAAPTSCTDARALVATMGSGLEVLLTEVPDEPIQSVGGQDVAPNFTSLLAGELTASPSDAGVGAPIMDAVWTGAGGGQDETCFDWTSATMGNARIGDLTLADETMLRAAYVPCGDLPGGEGRPFLCVCW